MSEKPANYEIPTVKFDASQVTDEIKADLRQNIDFIDLIPVEDRGDIYAAALETIVAGGNLPIVYQALLKINGMTKRRAGEIATSLNRKAQALMEVSRQKRIGIKDAIWLYSGAPCDTNDAQHHAANGNRYSIDTGMRMKSGVTWPGREDGCKCVSKPVIPGFD